jgi:hypothetical protein
MPKEEIPIEDLNASEDVSYQEYPVKILEMFKRVTQNKKILEMSGCVMSSTDM